MELRKVISIGVKTVLRQHNKGPVPQICVELITDYILSGDHDFLDPINLGRQPEYAALFKHQLRELILRRVDSVPKYGFHEEFDFMPTLRPKLHRLFELRGIGLGLPEIGHLP